MKTHIQQQIDLALDNAKADWKRRYYELAEEFLRTHEVFEGGELKAYCKAHGLDDPHSHNVWGSMVQSLARAKGWTVKIGEVEPTTAHTHIDRVGQWRSLIYDPAAGEQSYDIITDKAELLELLSEIGEGVAAIDLETTAFTPDEGVVRLAQIANDDFWFVVDFGVEGKNWFHEVAEAFENAAWVAFNSGFEKRWFAAAQSWPTIWDVGHLRRSIEGGGHMTLKALVGWELGHEMDKTEQASNWNAPELTQSQLDYAADDADLTWQVWRKMMGRATPGQRACFNMLDGMVDAVVEMEETGLKLDNKRHRVLIKQWQRLRDEREAQLRELITEDEVANLNSGKQLNAFFSRLLPDGVLNAWPKTEKTGQLSTANKDLLNMAGMMGGTPVADALRLLAERSTLEKYLSSFGEGLISKAQMDRERNRVHARYNIGAAVTCRFSCSGPNLQQIPRDRDFFGERMSVRQSFVAERGNRLVSLDYSGIEMRVLALLSGDEALLHDVVHGDPHAVMAEYVVGRPIDKKVTEDYDLRQSMKAVNFGIVYGTTALGLAGRQGWTFSFAEDLLAYWSRRYSKAWALRQHAMAEAKATGYLEMVDGGTIFMGKRPSPTRCANYPVQRAALSVMARAIARHHDSLMDYRQSDLRVARLASTIHDALIDEVRMADAMNVLRLMQEDMVAGYLDVFPGAPTDGLVEGGIGKNWGQLEDVELEEAA